MIPITFGGLDIWIVETKTTKEELKQGPTANKPQSDLSVVSREEVVSHSELSSWLEENEDFSTPDEIRDHAVKGRFRLLYQRWPADLNIAGENCIPMTPNVLGDITNAMDLPRCFLHDFASRKSVPLRIKKHVLQESISKFFLSTCLAQLPNADSPRPRLAESSFARSLHDYGCDIQPCNGYDLCLSWVSAA